MIKGVIFDMDGTVTRPSIDWGMVRQRIGVPSDRTIIDHISSLNPLDAERANRLLLKVEMEASVHSELNPGVHEMLDYLRAHRIGIALVTNNHLEAMQAVLTKHGIRFDLALCRDDGRLKPSGDLILKALKGLSLRPHEALSIGDGRYDMEASSAAHIPFLYITHGNPTLDHKPAVPSLLDSLAWLQEAMEASPGAERSGGSATAIQ